MSIFPLWHALAASGKCNAFDCDLEPALETLPWGAHTYRGADNKSSNQREKPSLWRDVSIWRQRVLRSEFNWQPGWWRWRRSMRGRCIYLGGCGRFARGASIFRGGRSLASLSRGKMAERITTMFQLQNIKLDFHFSHYYLEYSFIPLPALPYSNSFIPNRINSSIRTDSS